MGELATPTQNSKKATLSPSTRSKQGRLFQPHVLDLRSLALFRILFGLLQLCDVYGRLCNGKYDLAWYTSDPPQHSFLRRNYTYFYGPLSQFSLFRRGSEADEIFLFAVYTVCLIFLTVGYQCQKCWLLPLIWLMLNSIVVKCAALNSGVDQLASQLLMIMCFLPLSEVWSVDAFLRRRQGDPSQTQYKNSQVQGVACLGLTLQIVMMYVSCFFARTFDSFTIDKFHESDWLWPDYSLIHYCANGSGTRNNWLINVVRETGWLNQLMTISGFLVEAINPVLCLLFNQRYSHWFALPLVLLHFGINQILVIVHFAWMGMIIHSIWIPTHVWDRWLGQPKTPPIDDFVAEYKKTDGDEKTTESYKKKDNEYEQQSNLKRTTIDVTLDDVLTVIQQTVALSVRLVSRALSWTFLYLLIATFCYNRNWLVQWTELPTTMSFYYVRFNNYWGMWSPSAARESPYTMILGFRNVDEEEESQFNIYHFMKTGEEIEFEGFSEHVLPNFVYQYPSTRWEQALAEQYEETIISEEDSISKTVGTAMCYFVNDDLAKLGRPPIDGIEIITHIHEIGAPGSNKRYGEYWEEHPRYVSCHEEEEEEEEE